MRKTILVLASMALAMVVLGGVAFAATIQCPNGATKDGYRLCFGTKSADTMNGTPSRDAMQGKGGGDTMRGYGDRDRLKGLNGSDTLYGGDEGDRIMIGGLGSDTLYGGPGNDGGMPGVGCVYWYCSRPAELDSSSDYIHGGPGMDRLIFNWSKGGVDYYYGEDGNDDITVNQSGWVFGPNGPVTKEVVDCGPGDDDTVTFDEGVDDIKNCENLYPHYEVP
jgi:Ca2+-binding RTX toxin-like protein